MAGLQTNQRLNTWLYYLPVYTTGCKLFNDTKSSIKTSKQQNNMPAVYAV